ncbi:hypothetical protein F2P81_014564 [Scophthalmus maximus]|uniref:Uncharacterized protein n=1 Tax=Scophthalmus maximus TaxID=52904 RepID=A0A6A4SMG4_SCOMX|nr:hypothetical protein F2P81_014564 [Scophthalmus maximus]
MDTLERKAARQKKKDGEAEEMHVSVLLLRFTGLRLVKDIIYSPRPRLGHIGRHTALCVGESTALSVVLK